RRIAHNVAGAKGDRAKAAAILADLERGLVPGHAAVDDGGEIVGARYPQGARSLVTILVRGGGPRDGGGELAVRSEGTARARGSLTIADPTEREVGIPLPLAPQRWKKGFLYSDQVPIRKRPGTEVFRALFWARGKARVPKAIGGNASGIVVLTLK